MNSYNCEASTIGGFVQQLAVSYVGRGYYFYVTGFIPSGKDPRTVDAKLISRYSVGISKWARARKKRTGQASIQYIRLKQFFVLLATAGTHRFFLEEAGNIHDIRCIPIVVGGYSIGSSGSHPHVRIDQKEYLRIKAYLLNAATCPKEQLEKELQTLPFEPYAPVRAQLFALVRIINRKRRSAGLTPISSNSLRLRRRIYRPFEPVIIDDQSQLLTGTG